MMFRVPAPSLEWAGGAGKAVTALLSGVTEAVVHDEFEALDYVPLGLEVPTHTHDSWASWVERHAHMRAFASMRVGARHLPRELLERAVPHTPSGEHHVTWVTDGNTCAVVCQCAEVGYVPQGTCVFVHVAATAMGFRPSSPAAG